MKTGLKMAALAAIASAALWGCDGDNGTGAGSAEKYQVTVLSDGTGATGNKSYAGGDQVFIDAGTPPANKTFDYWTTSSRGVSFNNASSATTWFTMPSNAVTVTANWEQATTEDTTGGGGVDVDTFIDVRDGKAYRAVTIGGKRWMAENLNYDTASGTGSWCYGDNSSNCSTYGRLYNWTTAMNGSSSSNTNPSGVRGVCPVGWHLPSRVEWRALAIAAGGTGDYGNGGTAGKKLKSTTGWYSSGNGTDEYGFSALPGGYRYSDGSFGNVGNYGFWWTATELDGSYADYRYMYYDIVNVDEYYDGKSNAFSVRCLED
ncbi:hypothetical protein R80B4_00121 [Fibrobacteres bacterium R8-0-B4]